MLAATRLNKSWRSHCRAPPHLQEGADAEQRKGALVRGGHQQRAAPGAQQRGHCARTRGEGGGVLRVWAELKPTLNYNL